MDTKVCQTAPTSCLQLRFGGAWQRLILTLLVALCCHIAASAETLTVYNGTNNSNYLPVYGFGVDTQGTTSEFVIPKEQLGAMEDGTISALTFYLQTRAAAAWTATIQVYLKEINATTLTGITGPEASTVVYTGTLNATGTEMTVTFDDSYTYNGGNLLIGTYVSEISSHYDMTAFYGVTQTVPTAYYKKGSTTSSLQFIPKTTFTYDPSGTVPKPNNLAASNITYEKATITWTSDQSAWDIAWSTDPDFDPASATTHANNVSENTYTITSLSQLTDYYVAVQNAGSGKWSQKLHFKTYPQPTAVGDVWIDDFEGTTCVWELFNGELTNQWAWGTAANNGGTHALYISNDGGITNAYTHSGSTVYAARLLTFTEGKFKLSYDWRANGESTYDYLRVALIPATESLTAGTTAPTGFGASALPTGWIALDGGSKLNLETDWQSKVATIDVADAGNYYLVFAWRNDGSGGNNPPAAIDNVSIGKYLDEITDLAVSGITTITATVSWNGNGDSYNVRYKEVILSEGFEGGMPTGWTNDGSSTWSVGTGDDSESTGSHSGGKNALIKHTTSSNETYLITPSMDLSGKTSLTLSFWYINRAFAGTIDGIAVYYRVGTDGTWTELWSTTEAHESWTNQEVTLTGFDADYQLGFKMTDGWGHGVGLDDIQIASSADWQTVNNITTKSTTLTGLDANTTYGYQVQGVNAVMTTDWSPIATFTTMQLKNIATCDITVPNQTLEGPNNPFDNIRYKFEYVNNNYSGDYAQAVIAGMGVVVKDGETVLQIGTDYQYGSVTMANGDAIPDESEIDDECKVEIVGIGYYTGTVTREFKIAAPDANGTWGNLTWAFHDGTLTISGTGAMNATTQGSYPWHSIANYIETITIGEGITSVAANAFAGTQNVHSYGKLASISLPSTLTTIGNNAFAYCSALPSVEIPASVTSIGTTAFNQCGNLNSVTLNSNPTIGEDAFNKIKNGATVTMNLAAAEVEGAHWTTFYNNYGNFQADENTEVYKGAVSESKLVLTAISDKIVNAGNAVILKSTGNPVMTLTTTNSSDDFTDNALKGLSERTEIATSAYSANTIYVMGNKSNKFGFHKYTGAYMPANKAFLALGSGSSAPLRMVIDDDEETTGVASMADGIDDMSDVWYTLDGRKLNSKPTTKGLYIVNGKKVMIK